MTDAFHSGGIVPPSGGFVLHGPEYVVPYNHATWRDTPCARDRLAGCRCEWAENEFRPSKLSARCPIDDHRVIRSDLHRPRRIARELVRDLAAAVKRLVFWGGS